MKKEKEKQQQPKIGSEAESFFKESPPSDIDSQEDNKSSREEDTLFNFTGNFKNFGEYLTHEEFIIKKLNNQSERKLREKNAELAFKFSSIWAIFIGVIILLKGFGDQWTCFYLSQAEFLFVIGSLTASIFAFYILVLKYLFYRNENNKNSK